MTYETFKQEISDYLLQQKELGLTPDELRLYEDGFTSDDKHELHLVRETNIKYHRTESDTLIGDFLVISEKGNFANICRLDLKYLFGEWQKRGWDAILDYVKGSFAMGEKVRKAGVLKLILDYEAVRDHLIIRPLNFTDRRYDLKDAIYRRVGDIVLVLYLLASDESVGGRHDVISIRIRRNIFDKWGVDEEEVWQAALLNTNVMSPPRLYVGLKDMMNPPYTKGAFMAIVDWHFLVTAWLQIIITAYAAVLQYIITISGFPSPPSADLRLCASVEKEDMG